MAGIGGSDRVDDGDAERAAASLRTTGVLAARPAAGTSEGDGAEGLAELGAVDSDSDMMDERVASRPWIGRRGSRGIHRAAAS